MPKRIKKAANVKSPFRAKTTATSPLNKFASVIKFGMCFLIIINI